MVASHTATKTKVHCSHNSWQHWQYSSIIPKTWS